MLRTEYEHPAPGPQQSHGHAVGGEVRRALLNAALSNRFHLLLCVDHDRARRCAADGHAGDPPHRMPGGAYFPLSPAELCPAGTSRYSPLAPSPLISFDYYSYMHCDAAKWAAVQAAFRELRALSQQPDFPVLLVSVPLLSEGEDASFDGYEWRPIHERVAQEATLNGFSSLDLLPHFAKRKPIELKVEEDDRLQPNGLGNQIAATAIYGELLHMGFARSSSD